MASMIETVPVEPHHHRALASFLADFEDGDESPEQWQRHFRHWWLENPAAEETEHGWLLRDDEEIVGFLGMIPTDFRLGGAPAIAYSATTWRVREAYRSHSLGLLLRAIKAAGETVLFNTTPNSSVSPILERLGFQRIPRLVDQRARRFASVLIVRPRAVVARRLGGGFLANLTGILVTPLVRLWQGVHLRGLAPESIEIRRVERADASFDALWDRTRSDWQNTPVRSSSALNWYCFDGPQDRVLIGAYEGTRLLGFSIFRVLGEPARLLDCVDLWCDSDREDVVDAIVAGAGDLAKKLGVDAVVFPHFDSRLGKRLRALRLLTLGLGDESDYFRVPGNRIPAFDSNETYLGDTQGDATFF